MNIKPLYDRVLIERLPSEKTTSSGLYIPDTAKEKPLEGVVKAVGDGRVSDSGERVAMTVKVGDKVLFGKYSGTEVTVGGVEHLILREDEILAVMG